MKYLKAEKACRTDLEMYVAVINAQKNTLENDTDKIRNELKEGENTNVLAWFNPLLHEYSR